MPDEPVEIKVEKLEAKFDLFDNLRKAIEEKISYLSEQIGELRSMLIEREKFYKEIELSARKMEAIIEMIKKEELIKAIQRREKDVLENKARIERIEKLTEKFSEEMKELRALIEKMKPIENVIELAEKTEEKLKAMDEKKHYVDLTAEKIEKLFVDMKKFMNEFEIIKSDSKEMKNEIKDILEIVDSLTLEVEKQKETSVAAETNTEVGDEWGSLYTKWKNK